MPAPVPFADHEDYARRGHDPSRFSSPAILDERLAAASRHVRARCRGIDERIANQNLDPELVVDVVCAMVARAVPSTGLEGIATVQQGAGPFSQTKTLANPGGDLYLTRSEKVSLGCAGQRAGEVDPIAAVRA